VGGSSVDGGGGGGWHCRSVVVVDGSDDSIVWQRQVHGFTHIPMLYPDTCTDLSVSDLDL
jgi:hypothetical protein